MKKTVIKSLSVLICVLMMSPVLSGFFAFAADDAFTSGSFTYTVDENGNATITKLDSGVTGSIIIPQRIGGYPVVAIGESSFKNCILVTQITIPASVKSISASFTNLSALEKCYYTGTLVQWFSIGFADAKCNPFSVTNEVYIDNNIIRGINASDIAGITELGKYSFANCANLEYVMFPASLQTIGNGCFYNCDNLISVSFPYGLKTISSQAFSDCDGIKEIHIPASVSSISLDSFSSCKNLEHISVDEGNSVFKSSGNCLIKGNTLLLGCKSSIIPENMGIETINSYAFRGCEGLERIDIPEGVVSIGNYNIFFEAPINGSNYPAINSSGAFSNCVNLREINLPESLTYICFSSFKGCSSLNSITLPRNLKHIGYAAFKDCTSLDTFIYNVENIERVNTTTSSLISSYSIFDNCSSLKNLVFGKAVKVIPPTLFRGLESVDTITLYNTVETIDEESFKGTDKYSRINFYGTPEDWINNYNRYFNSISYVHDIYYLAGTCEKTDDPTDVTVRYEYGTFGTPNDGELNLVVENINSNDSRFSSFKAIIDGNQYALYAIHMTDTNDNDKQPVEDNQVNIKIPVPAGVTINSYSSVYIHHRKADGTTERKKYSTGDLLIEDGYFLFDVGSFSEFAICVDDAGEHVDSNGDYICDICGDSLTYSAKLIINGETYNIIYHYGDTVIENLPEVPEKAGYTGEWEYTVNGSELNIRPVYTPITYYATFIAEGIQVGDKIPFTVEDESIAEPAVPEKEGYTGRWTTYTLAASDITVTAIYEVSHTHSYTSQITQQPTCINPGKETFTCSCGDSYTKNINPLSHSFTNYIYNNDATTERDGTETSKCDRCDITDTRIKPGTKLPNSPDTPANPTANAKINVKSSQTVDYRARVTVTATADNVPDGYMLAIYEGSALKATGDTKTVSYYAGEMKDGKTFIVKVIDANGNVQKDGNNKLLSGRCEVNVKSGFFDKIIAFFRGLFGALPNIEVKQ